MSNIVAIKSVLMYARINLEIFESEILATEILACTNDMYDWAQEESADVLTRDLIDLLDKKKAEDGIYCVIGLYSLSGGTSIGPESDEYWSQMETKSELQITRLEEKDIGEFYTDYKPDFFSEDEKKILFPITQNNLFTLR